MVGCHFVEPCRKRTALVVLEQLVVAHQLRKNIHCGVFSVFPGRQRPSAKAENGGCVLPVQHPPGIGVPCPCPCNRLFRLRLSRRAHPLWSLPTPKLIPS